MSNPKSPAWYGGGLGAFMLPGANLADNGLFYVDDVNGLDTNTGLSPDNAVQTITYALSLCTNGDNNYIIVLQYGNNAAGEAAWPIPVNIDNVQIIAAQSGSFMPTVNVVSLAAAVFQIAAHNVRLQGFCIRPGGANEGITFAGSHGSLSIFDCLFDMGTYGIHDPAAGVGWGLEIARCWFGGNITTGGIYIQDDPGIVKIHDNIFNLYYDSGQIAIRVENGANGMILDNRFAVHKTDTTGYAIYLEAATHRWMVDGNHAFTGEAVPPVNPYRDLNTSAQGTNHWGLNYMGNTPTYPVVV